VMLLTVSNNNSFQKITRITKLQNAPFSQKQRNESMFPIVVSIGASVFKFR
jgi:hypothetical protein